jgi:hypothetical protein
MKRDAQQQAVYRWEAEWKAWNVSSATLPEMRAVVRWALRRYGIKRVPVVRQHHDGKYAWSLLSEKHAIISLQKRTAKNAPTVLHEAAHQICDTLFPSGVQDHGPEFLGIHMALLQDAGTIPVEALHASALKHKLKWMPYAEIGPQAIKGKR